MTYFSAELSAEIKTIREDIIRSRYDGDEEHFWYERTKKRAQALDWQDIVASIEHCPSLHEQCVELMISMLGYLPPESSYLPHQPYLRYLLQSHQSGAITKDKYDTELYRHMQDIRNDDMQRYGWNFFRKYRTEDYQKYDTHLVEFKELARSRLSYFLGYEPHVEVSLEVEIAIREALANDKFPRNLVPTNFDRRMIAVIKYRNVQVSKGFKTADKSDL